MMKDYTMNAIEETLPRSRLRQSRPSNASSLNATKKHGFSLGRFSLRRFLNPSSYSRTATLNNKRSSHHAYSESGSSADNKSVSNVKATSFCPTYSSVDFESTSISSGRSDLIQAEASGFLRFSGALESVSVMECPLCLLELPIEYFPELATCSHRACYDCMQKYLKIEISESRINISCPECTEPIHPNDIRIILNDEKVLSKYESFMLRRVLVAEPDARWCPAPDCGYVVVAAGCASCPKLKCGRPGCATSFCYHCKQEWHPNQTCDAARAQRNHSMPFSQNPMSSSLTFSRDSITQRDDIKPCPCCKVLVIKMDDGSCNHMTCCVCGTEFCWLCMKEISDLHYLSPSGCTFWGKKPWSRKKKILWQLGMLVGAPVGIALIAGIAVPAIIIGIPVWVGRKLHARFEKNSMSKHKKNLLITSGVLTSILVSPILATIAVGIGVPILLAYVYGVVPISLCRSGGCGVSTSPSGVRIEMDEENEIGLNSNAAAAGNITTVKIDNCLLELFSDGLSVDTALSNKGVNPSIGEVSFGMSTSISMGSGTHLDRVGADRESASNAALAGSIASANTCIAGPKLDIQSDSSSHKRYSVSSETASATVSLSERSANYSLGDDASTRALAGSIVGYRDVCIGTSTLSNAITPVEVHVDTVTGVCGNEHSPCCCDEVMKENQSLKDNDGEDNGRKTSQSVNSRCVSFQSNGTKPKISKYESRSLEQLSAYCEYCNRTHRPCCPNYNSDRNSNQPQQQQKSDTNRANKNVYDEYSRKTVMKNCTKASYYNESQHRKGSIKSTRSDTTPTAGSHVELKRVKSSKSDSTPTSPIAKQSSSRNEVKSAKMERAYSYSHKKKTKAIVDCDTCIPK